MRNESPKLSEEAPLQPQVPFGVEKEMSAPAISWSSISGLGRNPKRFKLLNFER
jgi:hypothetical protein